MDNVHYWLIIMSFSQRIVTLRKQRGLTQQGLSDATGIHVQQIKRYEAGSSLPTADALKKLAIILHVTADFLLFEPGEREPEDDMKLRFEAVAAMPEEDREVAKAVLDAMIVKSQVTQTVTRVGKTAAKEKS
ncbi:helix-turn-helix transcriptional regulator [Sodalis ligni]|nr:helix-turn-helix transcriptional regulator [Sodalis ligni]QWA11604.1 helix-turn-helix transcriptional regulator [Sodalis ligni]QWA11610.1 helix-turn-helix transcriptional regulator [Sodalis ligni]